MAGIKIFNTIWILCLVAIIVAWCTIDILTWNCDYSWYNTIYSEEQCSPIENWIGQVLVFVLVYYLGEILKITSWIMLVIALIRISSLVNKLKELGYSKSRYYLWLHILYCFFDIICGAGEAIYIVFFGTNKSIFEPNSEG